jgi:hypothetical protein
MAFKVMRDTVNNEKGNLGCTNVMLFMTDGSVTEGLGSDGNTKALVDQVS